MPAEDHVRVYEWDPDKRELVPVTRRPNFLFEITTASNNRGFFSRTDHVPFWMFIFLVTVIFTTMIYIIWKLCVSRSNRSCGSLVPDPVTRFHQLQTDRNSDTTIFSMVELSLFSSSSMSQDINSGISRNIVNDQPPDYFEATMSRSYADNSPTPTDQ